MVIAVVGAGHDLDAVAGADVAGLEHPQVGAGRAVRGEPLDQLGDVPEALRSWRTGCAAR